jgi:hypothetical protein
MNYKNIKSFVITHPLEKEKYLIHSCLEGSEAGVYYRGEGEIEEDNTTTTITLPNYVNNLCIKNEYTVIVTPIFDYDELDFTIYNLNNIKLMASNVKDGKFKVYGMKCKFNWVVLGKRFSIETSPSKNNVTLRAIGPYTYLENGFDDTFYSDMNINFILNI